MNTKKEYVTPSLTVHGDIETITKSIGSHPAKDSVFVNGEPLSVPTDGGSGDIIIRS